VSGTKTVRKVLPASCAYHASISTPRSYEQGGPYL
jgi:hypothetical protein